MQIDYSNYTWRRVQVMKLLIMQFFQPPVTSSLFGLNILLNTLFSNTLSLCSSLNVRDQVSHICKTTDKIIILQILIFLSLDSRRTLNSSGEKINLVQKYSQFYTFLDIYYRTSFYLSSVSDMRVISLGSSQPLTDMSTRNLSGGKGPPAGA
jgi:hypothetical protein